MKLKLYCVTVMDNWTPMREFWTLEGAKKFYRDHRSCANVFKWNGEAWCWMCGALDLNPPVILSPVVYWGSRAVKIVNHDMVPPPSHSAAISRPQRRTP